MFESRRIEFGFGLSVLLHLIVFSALALLPEETPTNPAKLDDQKLSLEVRFEPPREDAEKAEKQLIEKIDQHKEVVPVVPVNPQAIKAQLDPAKLKKVDKAPEHPVMELSHNSDGSKLAKGTHTGARSGKRNPEESASIIPSVSQTPEPAESTPTPTPRIPRPTPIPSKHMASMMRTSSLPRPTPIPRSTVNAPPTPAALATFGTPVPTPPKANKQLATGMDDAGENGEDDETAVAAVGVWRNAISGAISSCWNFYRQSKMDLMGVGEVRIKFAVDAQGHVSDVRVISNTAKPTNAIYAVRSVKEAEIPPIPPDRLARVPGGRVEITFTCTIYPTQ